MCLLLFAYRCHPEYPLLLLANRDEFYDRPSTPAGPWADGKFIAGRDLEAGGTWAGMARGRAAAVTNIREPGRPTPAEPLSRGDIPRNFLLSSMAPRHYADSLQVSRYRGFNALLFQLGADSELVCAGNRHTPFAFTTGVHGISNGAPDAPWPKVEKGKAGLARLIEGIDGAVSEDNFVSPALELLQDRATAPPAQLPDTGVGHAMEMALSPLFVQIEVGDSPESPRGGGSGGYGTRASTLIAIDRRGASQLWERTYIAGTAAEPLRHFSLD